MKLYNEAIKRILPDQDLNQEDHLLMNTPSQGEDEFPLRLPNETLTVTLQTYSMWTYAKKKKG